ncbi:MAG TPA: tyrosine-type recombinase/integrase, partial [Agitococcus sp.]|nr:tyrosine-type recombinase/integrase [Agitococcus sp.]
RERRDEYRRMVATGIDPSANRKASKLVESIEVQDCFKLIALEWLNVKKSEWVSSHYSKIESRLKREILPWLGDKAITEIKPIDILTILKRIQERGTLETAHRAKSDIGQIFRYAIQTDRAKDNPTIHLSGALKTPKEKHMASIVEPEKVGDLLRQIDGYQGTFIVRCALQLAPLVFVRPGELRQAEWNDINLETAEWRFKASKTHQDHIVPLSKQALEVLKTIQPYSGHGLYVFPGLRGDDRPMSNNAILSAFRRMGIEKEEMSGHGFRAMARTLLAERLRFPDSIIEHQLAHQVRDVHGRAYNRTKFLDDRKKMMQDWADYLDNLRKGEDVLPDGFTPLQSMQY